MIELRTKEELKNTIETITKNMVPLDFVNFSKPREVREYREKRDVIRECQYELYIWDLLESDFKDLNEEQRTALYFATKTYKLN